MLVRLSRLLPASIIIAFHGFEINTVVEHATRGGRGGGGGGKIDSTTRFDVRLECAAKVEIIDRQKWAQIFNLETRDVI